MCEDDGQRLEYDPVFARVIQRSTCKAGNQHAYVVISVWWDLGVFLML